METLFSNTSASDMPPKSVCISCLRTLRLQARRNVQGRLQTPATQASVEVLSRRPFSTSPINDQKSTQPPPPPNTKDPIANFAAQVRSKQTFKSTTEPYVAYGSTEELFKECAKQCNYTIPAVLKQPPEPPPKNAGGEDIGEGQGWWYEPKADGGLGLDVSFNTWAQVMYLHMYVLTVRLRAFPADHAKIWHQNLLDHFFYAAEDRMAVWHGMVARGTRNKYLKDLWQQWRGILFSYDEGLIKGDAVLAAAIWRNVFKANVETDIGDLALVTAYLRAQLQNLDALSDDKLAAGEVKFSDPRKMKSLLDKESPWMQKKFTDEELNLLEEKSG